MPLALASTPGGLPAQSAVSKEYLVKAAFLFNFAQFVEWLSRHRLRQRGGSTLRRRPG